MLEPCRMRRGSLRTDDAPQRRASLLHLHVEVDLKRPQFGASAEVLHQLLSRGCGGGLEADGQFLAPRPAHVQPSGPAVTQPANQGDDRIRASIADLTTSLERSTRVGGTGLRRTGATGGTPLPRAGLVATGLPLRLLLDDRHRQRRGCDGVGDSHWEGVDAAVELPVTSGSWASGLVPEASRSPPVAVAKPRLSLSPVKQANPAVVRVSGPSPGLPG